MYTGVGDQMSWYIKKK